MVKSFWNKTIREPIVNFTRHIFYYIYALRYRFVKGKTHKLHVGCGKNYLNGWINADVVVGSDMIVFMQKKIPLRDNTLNRLYSEHVIEHVPLETGVFFLREAYRVLAPGGVIRIATPDLDDLVDGYMNSWKRFDWVNWPEHSFIKSRAQMINIAFRWWGHQHLYNKEELVRALTEAGFNHYKFVEFNQSEFTDMQGLETRLDSKLIVEAVK